MVLVSVNVDRNMEGKEKKKRNGVRLVTLAMDLHQ